jgi:hypothetical protein
MQHFPTKLIFIKKKGAFDCEFFFETFTDGQLSNPSPPEKEKKQTEQKKRPNLENSRETGGGTPCTATVRAAGHGGLPFRAASAARMLTINSTAVASVCSFHELNTGRRRGATAPFTPLTTMGYC